MGLPLAGKHCSRSAGEVVRGGGASPKRFAHLTEWADSCMPIGGAGRRPAIPEVLPVLDAYACFVGAR